MRLHFIFIVLFSFGSFFAQKVEVLIPGNIKEYDTKSRLGAVTIYVVQDGMTLNSTMSDERGDFMVSAAVFKSKPFELQISSPGHLTKKALFNIPTMVLPRRQDLITIKLMEHLQVFLFATKTDVDLSFVNKDYSEKFTWNESKNIIEPDDKFKKEQVDKVVKAIEDAEKKVLYDGFRAKSTSFEQLKNYVKALEYLDSATKLNYLDPNLAIKRIELDKYKAAQDVEAVNQVKIEILMKSGDSLIKLEKMADAKIKFDELLKVDALNQKAKSQKEFIGNWEKAEIQKKQVEKPYLANMNLAYDQVKLGKFPEAIKLFKKSLSLNLSTAQKNRIQSVTDSLDLFININNELALVKSPNDFELAKVKYEKVETLIASLSNPTSQSEQRAKVNAQIVATYDKEGPQAYDLINKNKYNDAIVAYKRLEVLISLLSDQTVKQQKIQEINQRIKEANDKKDTELANFSKDLILLHAALDSCYIDSKLYIKKVRSKLLQEPFKSKAKEKQVTDLSARIVKTEAYYLEKISLDKIMKNKVLTQKDTTNVLVDIEKLLILANTNEVGNMEINVLNNLKLAWQPLKKNAPVAVNNTRGTILSIPAGATLITSGLQNSLNEMNATISNQETRVIQEWENLARSVERRDQNQASFEQERINKELTQYELSNKKIDENNKNEEERKIQDALSAAEYRTKFDNARDAQSDSNLLLLQKQEDQITKLKDDSEKYNERRATEKEDVIIATESFYEKIDQDRIKAGAKEEEKRALAEDQQIALNDNAEKQRKIEADKNEKILIEAQNNIEVLANFKDNKVNQANYLRDENNLCFSWNAMTEKNMKFLDSQNYTNTILVRRVVVDENGYGVVYEKTTGSDGQSSYTMDGMGISETYWSSHSSGDGVVNNRKGPITPICD